jgi:hypothetical protein
MKRPSKPRCPHCGVRGCEWHRPVGPKPWVVAVGGNVIFQGVEQTARARFEQEHAALAPGQSLCLTRPDGRTEFIVHNRKEAR